MRSDDIVPFAMKPIRVEIEPLHVLAGDTWRKRMDKPRVFADFHNADAQGRLRLNWLNCIGTVQDLARQQISLHDGQWLTLYSEEIEADGVVWYFGRGESVGVRH